MRLVFLVALTACGRLGFGDTPAVDAEPPVDERCDPRIDATTVALYSFEGSLTSDTTTRHDAVVNGDVTPAAGPCGQGASFQNGGYLVVQDSPAFDLAEGSIELFVRVLQPGGGVPQGVLARDALNTDFDGHFAIAVAPTGQIWVRMQRATGASVFRCTAASIPAETWMHVGASFGPPGFRVWVDGIETTGTTVDVSSTVSCTEPYAFGIAGNDNTIVIGGANYQAANGTPTPDVIDPLTGAVDQIRIRSTWRDFAR